ncbi:MAG: hypothetical protein HON90_09540 [Halobacteriovoraceae bacterium]|nr:hypothetical protein [Halobacteriovoraceae bacterium]
MKYNLSEAPSHMIAAFGFLTNPNPNENIDGQVGMFKNINDASDYFLDKIALKLERSIDELDSVIKNGKPNRTVFVTNLALSLGKETANKIKEQPENQKIAFDKIVLASHLYGVKAQAETFLASAYYFGSFNFYGSHKFANQIITQTFKSRSTMTVSDIVGADVLSWNNLPSPKEARDFVLKIRKEKKGSNRKANDNLRGPRAKKASIFTQFLKLKQTKHKLAEAKKFFMLANESDYNYHKALIDLGTLPSQESYIVNANIYSNHSHAPLEVVNIRKKMFNNSQAIEIKNYTTNHKMLININKFFDPEVVEDLFAYAPNKFNPTKEFQGRGKHKKWNYLYGRSERWPDPKFGGLLPNGTKGNVRKDLATIYQHPSLAFLIPVMSLYR